MNPKKGQFKSRKINDNQMYSAILRTVGKEAGYQKGTPAKYTSEDGFQEATPKLKGEKPKRIRQAFGRE
jgi:hypothetical protein